MAMCHVILTFDIHIATATVAATMTTGQVCGFFNISFFIYSTNEYLDYMYELQQQLTATATTTDNPQPLIYYHHLFQ